VVGVRVGGSQLQCDQDPQPWAHPVSPVTAILAMSEPKGGRQRREGEPMNRVDRAQRAGSDAERETVQLARTLERAALEAEYAFLAGQNAYLAMRLNEMQGKPLRDVRDALRCLAAIPLDQLDEAAAGTSRAKLLHLDDGRRDNILLVLSLLRKIATGLERALDAKP
jgi:hypothetical protein